MKKLILLLILISCDSFAFDRWKGKFGGELLCPNSSLMRSEKGKCPPGANSFPGVNEEIQRGE